jgi:hypothetical protein
VAEVPSFERSRQYGTSNLNAFSDGIRVLRTIHVERSRANSRPALAPLCAARPIGPTHHVVVATTAEAS